MNTGNTSLDIHHRTNSSEHITIHHCTHITRKTILDTSLNTSPDITGQSLQDTQHWTHFTGQTTLDTHQRTHITGQTELGISPDITGHTTLDTQY